MSSIYEQIYQLIDAEAEEYFWQQIEELDGIDPCEECFDCEEWCKYATAA